MSDFVPFAVRSGRLLDLGLQAPKASRYDRPGEPPKHKCRILVPKSDKAALAAIKEAQDKALAARNLLGKPGVRLLLQDGDEVVDGKRAHPQLYAGYAFFTASCKPERPPLLQVGREKRAPTASDFYSGAEVAFAGSAFAYEMSANARGASALISLVWKIGPGEVWASGDAGEMLADLDVSWSADNQDRADLTAAAAAGQDGGLDSFFR